MAGRGRLEAHAAVLAEDFIQEKASALGRLGRALEAALAELAAFDAVHADFRHEPVQKDRDRRRVLLHRASAALWCFIVQRESCGLRNNASIMRDYRVPTEVERLMGAVPSRRGN